MKKISFNKYIAATLFTGMLNSYIIAQENMHPAPAQAATVALTNATIHVGNGQIIEKGTVVFSKGKIIEVSTTAPAAGLQQFNLNGRHIYPGVIASSTNMGLVEVSSVKATQDYAEIGDINPSIRSLVAYNTDSKIINTLRSNGVLFAHIVPQGGSISGTSSVVQLDAWNWEDAAYKADNGIHMNMPSLINRPSQGGGGRRQRDAGEQTDLVKQGLERVESLRKFFREAKAYLAESNHTQVNLKFEAVKGLYDQSKTLFVHCDLVKEILVAIDFAKEFGFKLTLVGAGESWMITDIIKANNVSVILSEPHSLPATDDDDVDQPYKTGSILSKAGILFTICQDAGDGFWQQRNLPFEAGTMAAYGLSKEEALTAITLDAAKILGIDDRTGSIEVGKDANLVICEGDLLDMKSSLVSMAFIQGRAIDLNNKHTQLFERYKYKYGIK